MNKKLLSGNEAIALAAWEAGVTVGAGYPGTPSTEILENFSQYPDIVAEWSINEKVAYEVGMGASLQGARTLITMKHVGLNVAADGLFTSAYIGVKGGFVVVSADDPDMNSSQNEQDNRHYAVSAKVPMLDPSDSQDAYSFMKFAYDLSEKYDTPVIFRTTTRISHSKTIVNCDEVNNPKRPKIGFERNMPKYVMIPAFARPRHRIIEERLLKLADDACSWDINRMEMKGTEIGFITSGISYHYVREAYPDASILKLGLINPLPMKLIKAFASKVKRLVVVEELDPVFEQQIKASGIICEGKAMFPITGELNQDIVRRGMTGGKKGFPAVVSSIKLPPRPPSLCPGCPHRSVFQILNKHKLTVTGDIGCYTLGVLPPFSAMDTCVEMGASVGMAQGMEAAAGKDYKNNVVAVIGDSTFAHSGISGFINAAYNGRHSLIIVLDNGITAMTGMQHNPFSGKTILNQQTMSVDYVKLSEAIGLPSEQVRVVNAYKPEDIENVLLELLSMKKLCLMVVKGLCVIAKGKGKYD